MKQIYTQQQIDNVLYWADNCDDSNHSKNVISVLGEAAQVIRQLIEERDNAKKEVDGAQYMLNAYHNSFRPV